MTIVFRLFGYAVCFSIAKVITIPYDRLESLSLNVSVRRV